LFALPLAVETSSTLIAPLFGALSVLMVFYISKEMNHHSNLSALFSAWLFAVLPSSIPFTIAGQFSHGK